MSFQLPTGGMIEQIRSAVEDFRSKIQKGDFLPQGGFLQGILPGAAKRTSRRSTRRRTPTRRRPTRRRPTRRRTATRRKATRRPTKRTPTPSKKKSKVVPHVTKPESYDFSYASGQKVGVAGEKYDFSY